MARISEADRDDFAGFCRSATDNQLPNILDKEKAANRRVYADIAQAEIDRRAALKEGASAGR